MRRLCWMLGAVALTGCIAFDRGGTYACSSFDDCGPAESCTTLSQAAGQACVSIAPLSASAPVYGKTEKQWAEAWAQWVLGLSSINHPLNSDPNGEFCATGQPDDAFFLAGGDVVYGAVSDRGACVAPAGKPLVFPLFWWMEDDNQRAVEDSRPQEQMRQDDQRKLDSVQKLVLEIDGRSFAMADLKRLRLDAFETSYRIDHDNPITNPPAPGRTDEVSPAYLTGYFVVLPPLRPGQHALRFGSSYSGADENPATLDSRYLLEVQ